MEKAVLMKHEKPIRISTRPMNPADFDFAILIFITCLLYTSDAADE